LQYVFTDGLTTNGYWTNQNYSNTVIKLDPVLAEDFASAASFSGLGYTTPNESAVGITTTYPNTYYPSAVSGDYFLVGYTGSNDNLIRLLLQKQSDGSWEDIKSSDLGNSTEELYYATNTEKFYLGGGLNALSGTTVLWYDVSLIDFYLNYKNVSSVINGETYLIQQNKFEDFIKGTYDPIEDYVPSLNGKWERVLGGGSRYFYGPTAPTEADGITMGTKWFNTNLGLEFTYIIDDSTQWIVTNVAGISGQGEGGVGTQGFQGFQGFQGSIGIAGSGYTGAEIRGNNLYIIKTFSDGTTSEVNLGYIGPTGSSFVFDADITAAFGPNKTFGKYEDGDLIPAKDKTAVQVIKEALFDVLPPTVLASSNTVIEFYQETITNQITLTYTINTLGATATSTVLEHKRGGQSNWTTLDDTLRSSSFTYTHSTTKDKVDSASWDYRWIVTDSAGGTTTSNTFSITPESYTTPLVSFSQYKNANSIVSGETVTKRESGNTVTILAGSSNSSNITITSRENFVDITSWSVQYSINNAVSWTTINSSNVSPPNQSVSISPITHAPTETNINSIQYRLVVGDEHTSNNIFLSTITFLKGIFYGATSSYPTPSSNLRNLDNKYLSDRSNPFNLNTGTEFNVFVVALPQPQTIIDITDESAFGVSLFGGNNETENYVLNASLTSINNYSGDPQSYNVYIFNPSIPYSGESHIHEVTRLLT
jgi:hypothetical protein